MPTRYKWTRATRLPSFVTVLFFVLNTLGMAAVSLVSTYSVCALGVKVNVAK